MWKNEEFTLTEKIIRQIDSCNFDSKNVTFTKFLPKKCERVNFRNFHTVPYSAQWKTDRMSIMLHKVFKFLSM